MRIVIDVPPEFGDEVKVGVEEYVQEFFGEGTLAEDGTIKKIVITTE